MEDTDTAEQRKEDIKENIKEDIKGNIKEDMGDMDMDLEDTAEQRKEGIKEESMLPVRSAPYHRLEAVMVGQEATVPAQDLTVESEEVWEDTRDHTVEEVPEVTEEV